MSRIESQVKSSALWLFAGNLASRLLGFVSMVVVARLLVPEDFGMVSLATATWGLVTIIFAVSIGAAVIHHQEHDLEFLDTAFWMNCTVVALLMVIAGVFSPLAEKFYRTPGLSLVMWALAAVFLFNSLAHVHQAIVSRELAFKTKAVIMSGFQVLDTAATITMAILGFGYWSLVLPKLLLAPLNTLAWWKLCGWRPGFRFSLKHARAIFNYCIRVLGARLLNFININADFLIIGKALGQARLGLYAFAYNTAQWPINNFVFLINELSLPYFSAIRDDRAKVQNDYLKMLRMVSMASFPVFAGAALVAPEAIPLVFSEKWAPAVFAFQMLCLFGAVRSVGSPGGQLMLALGRPGILLKFNLVQAPVLIGAILFSTRYGISGVAAASLIVLGGGGVIFIGLALRLIELGFRDFLRAVVPTASSTVVMSALLFAHRFVYRSFFQSDWGLFLSSVVLGFAVYTLVLASVFRPVFSEAVRFGAASIKDFINSRAAGLTVLEKE